MDRDDGVNDFLARIKELGAQRDREDEERTRQLEKEILAGRQARQSRRAERAKSLSPMKTGDRGSRVFDGIDLAQLRNLDSNTPDQRREDAVNDALDKLTGKTGPSKEDLRRLDSPPPLFPRERRAESPWQRRPDSRGTVASETREESPRPESSRVDSENEYRRSFITKNLASKDLEFFKQTSERKVPSDVLLKNADERPSVAPKKRLPGMAKEYEKEPMSEAPVASSGNEPSKRPMTSYIRAHKSSPSMNSGLPNISKQNLFPMNDSMRFEPGGLKRGSVDETKQPAMSPSQGRIDPDWKPPSVSKGMGTFVQSAMLKREGSINKRWSATLPGRNSSPVSTQTRNSTVLPTERSTTPVGNSRGSSPAPSEPPSTPEPKRREPINRGRAKSIVESLSKYSTSGIHPAVTDSPKLETSPPTTPYNNPISKTFDQKRWSPTKASWLEVALKKGSEGGSGSPVLSKNTPILEPPVKQADHRPTVLPKPVNLPSKSVMDTVSNITNTSAALSQVTASSPKAPSDKPPALEKPTPLLPAKKLPPPVAEKPSTIATKPAPGPKVELDFRGNLKRYSTSSSPEKEDLPFLDVMSRLRSTRTQKYVAPNILKDNILAGKAALQDAGPPKPKPPDPVKERLLSAKGALKHSNSTTTLPETAFKPRPPPTVKQATAPGRIEVASLKPRAKTTADIQVPNLANLLSRGPPSYDKSKNFSAEALSTVGKSKPGENEESEKEGLGGDGPLTHITKTRARGPKRRQPTKAYTQEDESDAKPDDDTADSSDQILPAEAPPSIPVRLPSLPGVKAAPPTPAKPVLLDVTIPEPKVEELKASSDEPEKIKFKPPTPAKSPMLSAKTDFRPSPNTTPIPSPSIEKSEQTFSLDFKPEAASIPNISSVVEPQTETSFFERPIQPPAMGWLARRTSSARASGPQRTPFKSPQLEKVEEPTNTQGKPSLNLPTVEDEDDISELKPRASRPLPSIPNAKARGTQTSESGVRKVSYGSIPKHVDELNSFFKDPEAPNVKVDFDISKFLPSKTIVHEKPQTIKLDVWEMTSEGKVQALEPGKQNVLFEQNMYMCLSIFENTLGEKGAELYLWRGNQVSSAALEDALTFAKKMASENEAKMTIVKQGHETVGFLNALGGILITRRGSSKPAGTSPYVLCGRSFYDGIVFDEEDMKSLSLCSGFPFLIHSGETVYLWKGIGCTPKELAYARKVANDLTTGDVEDVDEGSEPQALIDIISDCLSEKAAAKYWEMKPAHDNYAARLFRCDMKSDQIITEISPFCQSDVELGNIYILDAFFEIYIVIGANSQSKRAEFQAALQFTQEYSKATHSIDSRPFGPPIFVLLGGVSREFKAVFRSWQPSHIPTTWTPSRKPSLRVVGLDDAMKAMNMAE